MLEGDWEREYPFYKLRPDVERGTQADVASGTAPPPLRDSFSLSDALSTESPTVHTHSLQYECHKRATGTRNSSRMGVYNVKLSDSLVRARIEV